MTTNLITPSACHCFEKRLNEATTRSDEPSELRDGDSHVRDGDSHVRDGDSQVRDGDSHHQGKVWIDDSEKQSSIRAQSTMLVQCHPTNQSTIYHLMLRAQWYSMHDDMVMMMIIVCMMIW